LRLNHERLSQRLVQNCPAIVHGVQKPNKFTTELPTFGRDCDAEQPEGVAVT